ncbi:MAG: rRNA maturation RNase YbeY [Anaerolineae bacterium]|nr:rRNA maturation RNase YbeY [Anaerolineae bacterium]
MDALIQVDDEFVSAVAPDMLQKAMATAAEILAPRVASACTLTITVTGNAEVAELNHQYRGVDAPTDVLSFEYVPDPDFPAHDPELADYLGDIIIAYPVAQAQAEAGGHAPQAEVTLLAVHGLLHLIGFDHDTPENKAEMWAAQQAIMARLGLAHIQPTET